MPFTGKTPPVTWCTMRPLPMGEIYDESFRQADGSSGQIINYRLYEHTCNVSTVVKMGYGELDMGACNNEMVRYVRRYYDMRSDRLTSR